MCRFSLSSFFNSRESEEDLKTLEEHLFFDVAEIIKRKQPKAIFLENVKGLRNHDKGKTLTTILNVLRVRFRIFCS
jgi:site-specific DNA-cytosine methylase